MQGASVGYDTSDGRSEGQNQPQGEHQNTVPEKHGASKNDQPGTSSNVPHALEELPWNLQLINGSHPLPSDFVAPELVDIPGGSHTIDSRVYDHLMAMLDAADKAGTPPAVCSAYRTYDYQRQLFESRVERCKREKGLEGEEAENEAAFWVARPGTSEHQAGLAVDPDPTKTTPSWIRLKSQPPPRNG